MHSSRDSGRQSGLEHIPRAFQIGAELLCGSTTVIDIRCRVDERLTAFHPFDQPCVERVARKRHRAQGLHYLDRTLAARESHHLKTRCEEVSNKISTDVSASASKQESPLRFIGTPRILRGTSL
jgi:hypothetical protein